MKSLPRLVLALATALAGGHCAGCDALTPDCSPGSDLWIKANLALLANQPNTALVICPKVGAGYSPPNPFGPEALDEPDAGSLSDACAACVEADCDAPALACFGADGAVCSASSAARAGLTGCVADHCSAECPSLQ